MKLNLGCGDKKMAGYINVDVCGEPDMLCDLSKFPWPFENGSVEEVFSSHFMEHVIDYEKTVLEIHRILRPGGLMHFKVPHFRSMFYPWHLHKYAFSSTTCRLLCERRDYQFGGRHLFEEVLLKFNYPYITNTVLKKIFSFCSNKIQAIWEYIGAPIDEIEFVAKKK
jgi:ubiquinone/menaquinone biosynthesis C-methylase UbiE